MLASSEIVPRALHTPVRIAIILVVALILNFVVRRVITRSMRGALAVRARAAPGTTTERSSARFGTLSTVVRSLASGLLLTIAAVTIIGELGVNLGAFVAGATVIGGAIAFGAQSLVRDVLAGIYVLAEDQYGVGDLVDLGLASGRVEEVTLRSTRVRDDQGRVWHVPNGAIQRAGNLSQEWGQAVLDVPVSLDADPDEAVRLLEALATNMAADPELAERVVAAPQVLGIQDLLDDRAVLRLLIRTRPGEQFAVMRAMRARVLKAIRDGGFPGPPSARTVVVRSAGASEPAAGIEEAGAAAGAPEPGV